MDSMLKLLREYISQTGFAVCSHLSAVIFGIFLHISVHFDPSLISLCPYGLENSTRNFHISRFFNFFWPKHNFAFFKT